MSFYLLIFGLLYFYLLLIKFLFFVNILPIRLLENYIYKLFVDIPIFFIEDTLGLTK